MPTIHHQNAEQEVGFAPATHTAPVLDNEPQQKVDAQASCAEPETITRNWLGRYEITWAGLLSVVKRSDVFFVAFASLLMVGIEAVVTGMTGKPFSLLPALFGTALLLIAIQLKEGHQARFTGHRPLSWIISWLFRATLFFVIFALLRVMNNRSFVVLDKALEASVCATGSVVWQYWRQSRRNAK